MTKKDFELVARALRYSALDKANQMLAARTLASVFAEAYPRFDHDRFVTACTTGL